jgi:hypothetical protein
MATAVVSGYNVEVFRTVGYGVESRRYGQSDPQWTPWALIPTSAGLSPLDVAAVSAWQGHAELLILSTDGTVWALRWLAAVGWQPFVPLGQPFGAPAKGVTAFSSETGGIEVYVEGHDGRIANRWHQNGGWSTPTPTGWAPFA